MRVEEARQLVLDFPVHTALGPEAYFVSASNSAVVEAVGNWRGWPGGKLMIVGPPASGKTHLARMWMEESGAEALDRRDLGAPRPEGGLMALESAHEIAGRPEMEEAMLRLHDSLQSGKGRLLMTADKPPAQWGVKLKDLASRLMTVPVAELRLPDDRLLSAVMVKMFSDRQLVISPRVIEYLIPRMERSFLSAKSIVDAADRAALAEGRAVTRQMASKILKAEEGKNG